MDRQSKLFEFLERMGIHTTRLRWKLYQWEKRRENKTSSQYLPASLHWLRYPNKHCMHCGKLVNGDERTCPQCGRHVPSLFLYRTLRLLGLAVPDGAPPVIIIFLVAMVGVFVLQVMMQGPSALFNPTELTLLVFGAWEPRLVLGAHQYWRYMSFGIEHIGLWHIGFNAFALMQIGPVLESQVGKVRMLAVITVTQITAALASQYWFVNVHHSSGALTAGASGWLFGLIGFGIALFWTQGSAARMYRDLLIQWAVYALVFGFLIGANNAAHVGGMLGGLVLGFVPEGSRRNPLPQYLWNGAAAVSVVLWAYTGLMMALFILANWTPGGAAGQ